MPRRSLIVAAAAGVDLVAGEPPAGIHPVVLIGRGLRTFTEPFLGRRPASQLAGGAAAVAATAATAWVAASAAEKLAEFVPGRLPRLAASALALKPYFAVRMLLDETSAVRGALALGDLDAARDRLRSLVSRPTGALNESHVAAAAIESVAENLGDSVAGPWLWFAVLGLPGAAVYRTVNTADSMYGYRGEMEWIGKFAAKADDALSWVPSRVAAAAIVAAAWLRLGPEAARSALEVWAAEGAATASPNAGRPMAAMAGALGVRLEKPGHYVVGRSLREPDAEDVGRAVDLAGSAALLLLAAIASALWFRGR